MIKYENNAYILKYNFKDFNIDEIAKVAEIIGNALDCTVIPLPEGTELAKLPI